MGIEGIEELAPDESNDEVAEDPRPDGEAERKQQNEEREQDHQERQERLSNPDESNV